MSCFRNVVVEYILKDFTGTFQGDEMIIVEVAGQRLNVITVLCWLTHVRWKLCPGMLIHIYCNILASN